MERPTTYSLECSVLGEDWGYSAVLERHLVSQGVNGGGDTLTDKLHEVDLARFLVRHLQRQC